MKPRVSLLGKKNPGIWGLHSLNSSKILNGIIIHFSFLIYNKGSRHEWTNGVIFHYASIPQPSAEEPGSES